MKPKILIIGAGGQIGTVLVESLVKRYGTGAVIASDLKELQTPCASIQLDVLDANKIAQTIEQHQITQIYHLAAILSAKGEQNPIRTWNINMEGLLNVLEAGRTFNLDKIFYPSSIAVFGKATPKVNTPQDAPLVPETVYGISKEAGENWCNYYYKRYGLDVRSLRYPGLIGYQSLAGGGTTDYAVDIFHYAVKNKDYTCFLNKDTRLPMMYMSDAVRATIELMETDKSNIKIRTSYNVSGMSFSPEEIYNEIKKHLPNFNIDYKADYREEIARSWVESINDSQARKDWNWKEQYDLEKMVADMIKHLS